MIKVSFSASLTQAEWDELQPKLVDAGLYISGESEDVHIKLAISKPEFEHVNQLTFDAEHMPMPKRTVLLKKTKGKKSKE